MRTGKASLLALLFLTLPTAFILSKHRAAAGVQPDSWVQENPQEPVPPPSGALGSRATVVKPQGPLPAPAEDAEAGPPPPSNVETVHPEIQQLRGELESILRSTGNRGGEWGVLAVSLDRHDTLLAMNVREPMVPASNMKLLSTAAALHHLGPDFRFQTFLMMEGSPSEGTLVGDLVLFGTGDPTLSERFFPSETAFMDSLASYVYDAGIREIQGNLVVDGSFFPGPGLHPEWDPRDFNDAYAAPVSALSLNENILTMRVEPGAWVGAQPSIHTLPYDSGLRLRNLARTTRAGSGSRIWLLRENPQDPVGIEGEISMGSSDVWRRLPVPDPLRFSGTQLLRSLEARGIRVRGRVHPIRDPANSRLSPDRLPGPREGGGQLSLLHARSSPPLIDLLRIVNKESNNFFAESVARAVGRTALGDGSFSGAGRAIEGFLVSEVGVSPEEIQVQDGSGLSSENRASPGVFVQVLEFMNSSPWWEDFWSTLPEAGARRELRRMNRSPAAGNLRAKTGTLDRVSALSGMVRTRSGERILFSILSNDVVSAYRAKRAEDQIGIRLASLTRPIQN